MRNKGLASACASALPPQASALDTMTIKFPIILIHGWTDKPAETGTWKVVERSLTKASIHFYVPSISRFGSIEERSQRLIEEMSGLYPVGQPVHLIGHSMGGIVARDIAARENLPFRILSATTLGSPNRGLRYLDKIPMLDGASEDAAKIRELFGTDFGGLTNLSCKFMSEFNRKTRNNPKVRYFSWAGLLVLPTLSYAPHALIVYPFYPKSDGIVGVDTAMWDSDLGPGTHLGTVAGLTHSSIVSLETFEKTLPHLAATELGVTLPVQPISSSLRTQLTRRVIGHKDAIQGRLLAIKDSKHICDEKHKAAGYVFNALDGYMCTKARQDSK
ncbi:hypothetical protein EST38_g11436 [Candolleomyces aberdarensis]|uniref:AB hydrolase-1 domain-containing protein n=1 Tax=Candolleomyces aberdarensis TaxID=2316362 RepID=A0A4Q2D6D2_9AGAR|nr:hypothetical protein EST38_g11436 [Candolleomyces aberdarensis]